MANKRGRPPKIRAFDGQEDTTATASAEVIDRDDSSGDDPVSLSELIDLIIGGRPHDEAMRLAALRQSAGELKHQITVALRDADGQLADRLVAIGNLL